MEDIQGKPTKISKSNFGPDGYRGNPLFVMENARARPLLAETIISYLLSTIVPRERSVEVYQHRRKFAQMAGELGVAATIDFVARQLSVDWFRRKPADILVEEGELLRQERWVIRNMHFFQFVRCLDEYSQSQGRTLASMAVLERLFSYKHECASWKEIVQIASHPRRTVYGQREVRLFMDKCREMRSASTTIRRSRIYIWLCVPLGES